MSVIFGSDKSSNQFLMGQLDTPVSKVDKTKLEDLRVKYSLAPAGSRESQEIGIQLSSLKKA